MKKLLTFALIAMIAGVVGAQGLTWMGDSAIYNADNTTWYSGNASWATPSFDGHDFGLVTMLTLGAEVQTATTTPGNITATMGYRIDSLGWQSLDLPYLGQSGGNEKWQNVTGVDMASGLSAGSHTIELYFQATDGFLTVYDNNNNLDYTASFQTAAVPEPATMSLLGLGALAMALRRKMRKVS